MLVSLREVLKAYALSSAAQHYRTISDGHIQVCSSIFLLSPLSSQLREILQLQLKPKVLKDVALLSAYKKFEIETCQLQVRESLLCWKRR